jgi:hypothetical protein
MAAGSKPDKQVGRAGGLGKLTRGSRLWRLQRNTTHHRHGWIASDDGYGWFATNDRHGWLAADNRDSWIASVDRHGPFRKPAFQRQCVIQSPILLTIRFPIQKHAEWERLRRSQ